MQILLTNDDGYQADGILSLRRTLSDFADVLVVAPERECSCCGHSVTTNRPLKVREVEHNRFAVDGFPADCVRVAIHHLHFRPDWVVSGINHGGNLGVDLWMSGTVAAAREAHILGFRAMAFSQYRRLDVALDWNVSGNRAVDLFRWVCDVGTNEDGYWNVNLPAIDPLRSMPAPSICEIDPSPLAFHLESLEAEVHYRSDYHNRPRKQGSDVSTCFSGIPSISRIPSPKSLQQSIEMR